MTREHAFAREEAIRPFEVAVVRYYHVWFSTRHRRPVLSDEEIVREIRRQMVEAAKRGRVEIIELALAVDHVHSLLALEDERLLASAVQRIEGSSSRLTFERFPDLRFDMKGTLWQKGYGHREVPVEQLATVRQYIATQLQRPLRREG
jgi:REP element-mobilizing transposase RayT